MRKTCFEIHSYTCPKCGLKFPIPRKKARRRGNGHDKYIYCVKCNTIINMKQDNLR